MIGRHVGSSRAEILNVVDDPRAVREPVIREEYLVGIGMRDPIGIP